MLLLSNEAGLVRDGHCAVCPEEAVVFGHENSRRDTVDRVEDPVVVAVDVDREQADVPGDAAAKEDVIHVVTVDEGRNRVDRRPPGESALLEEPLVGTAHVDDQAAPRVVHEQKPRVRLGVVLDAELDEDAVLDRHPLNEELDDSVLAELREDAELRLFELVGSKAGDPATVQASDLCLEIGDRVRDEQSSARQSDRAAGALSHGEPQSRRSRSNSSRKSIRPRR